MALGALGVGCGRRWRPNFDAGVNRSALDAFCGHQGLGFGLGLFEFGLFFGYVVHLFGFCNLHRFPGNRVGGKCHGRFDRRFARGGDFGHPRRMKLIRRVRLFFHFFKCRVFFQFVDVGRNVRFLFFDFFLFHGAGGDVHDHRRQLGFCLLLFIGLFFGDPASENRRHIHLVKALLFAVPGRVVLHYRLINQAKRHLPVGK